MSNNVLVVEREPHIADRLCDFLNARRWQVHTSASEDEALAMLATLRPRAILVDQEIPDMQCAQFIHQASHAFPGIPVVVMASDTSARGAVTAIKAGASDYLIKPVSLVDIATILHRLSPPLTGPKGNTCLAQPAAADALADLLGDSVAMQELKTTVRQLLKAESRLADGELPAVLICGETGTGKELVARALHFNTARHDRPFVEINCASIPPHLLEAELFGHEQGAFTDASARKEGLVEAADGGTLFLDEIGEIAPSIQAKLLKLLEDKTIRRLGAVRERKVNLRIVSATNRDLERLVRQGSFRSDLYFRLRIITIRTPPLRERGSDILLLARHFLKKQGGRYGKPGLDFSPQAEQLLLDYYWPGNVRELRNMLEETVLLAKGPTIHSSQLTICLDPQSVATGSQTRANPLARNPAPKRPKENLNLPAAERDLIRLTLEQTNWNVSKSARLLGLSRDMMRYRIGKLKLRPSKPSGPDGKTH